MYILYLPLLLLQAFGCGFNDSGHLYDLQKNKVIVDFPHKEGLNTDAVDVSLPGTHFVLGMLPSTPATPTSVACRACAERGKSEEIKISRAFMVDVPGSLYKLRS